MIIKGGVGVEITHSQYAVRALDWIFQRPIFQTLDFITSAQIPPAMARKIVRDVRDNGLLRELVLASGRTPATFVFSELLNILILPKGGARSDSCR